MTIQEPDTSFMYPMRLQKFLARSGVASRRGSEDLMTAGRVRVNGEIACELGTKVHPLTDVVEVDGVRVDYSRGKVYIILHKPSGYITTMSDPFDRPTVAELMPIDSYPGLFPVGRLDSDTTGLLLFTTDGDLAARLLHPSSHVAKVYHTIVDGHLRDDELNILRRGITLNEEVCAPVDARLLHVEEVCDLIDEQIPSSNVSYVELTLHEGKKRQVKRMMSAINHPVLRLHRRSFASLTLDNLVQGAWRHLTDAEITTLLECSSSPTYKGARFSTQEDSGGSK